ncbi:MAG: hypothetical protein SVW57_13600 [Thermodesulfobacteriota bacterium]|nr:hypothetical protein [Thermodesulfobacteriota bacterium]
MVEKIDIPKIFSPISSTVKVSGVKRQQGQTQKKRFDKQLQEEEEKNKKERKQEQQAPEAIEMDDEKENVMETTGRKGKISDTNKENQGNGHGRVVDIRV